MQKHLINGLTTISNCILLWSTSIWHNDVFYIHIIVYLKLQLHPRVVQSASWQSANCPVTQQKHTFNNQNRCTTT